MNLKSNGFKQKQEPFQKTYVETQFFSKNNLVQRSSFKQDADVQNVI